MLTWVLTLVAIYCSVVLIKWEAYIWVPFVLFMLLMVHLIAGEYARGIC